MFNKHALFMYQMLHMGHNPCVYTGTHRQEGLVLGFKVLQ